MRLSLQMAAQDELDLIKNILAGNARAFEQLVLRHQDKIYGFVYNMVRNDMDAEEITQDVFVKAYRNLDRFKGDAKFTTWLFSIAHNTTASYYRKKRIQTNSLEDDSPAMGHESQMETSIESLKKEERDRFIHQAMEKMAPQQRMLIQLFYLDELSIKEIEDISGLNAGTIKTGLMRGRNRLYTLLQDILENEMHELL